MPLTPSGKWNQIPDDLLPKIPDQETLVSYEVLDSFYDPVKKKTRWHASLHLPSTSVVRKGNKTIPIGLVGGVDQVGNLIPTEIRPLHFQPNENCGLIEFYIGQGNSMNDELYQYLELMSENESNPNRDTSVRALFRKKDYVQEAKQQREKRSVAREAMGIVLGMKPAEIKQTALLLGISADRDSELVLNDIEDYATSKPREFIDILSDPDKDVRAMLAKGLENGVFLINDEAMALTHSNNAEIMRITGTADRRSVINQFMEWLKEQDNPNQIIKGLKAHVDKSEKAQKG